MKCHVHQNATLIKKNSNSCWGPQQLIRRIVVGNFYLVKTCWNCFWKSSDIEIESYSTLIWWHLLLSLAVIRDFATGLPYWTVSWINWKICTLILPHKSLSSVFHVGSNLGFAIPCLFWDKFCINQWMFYLFCLEFCTTRNFNWKS